MVKLLHIFRAYMLVSLSYKMFSIQRSTTDHQIAYNTMEKSILYYVEHYDIVKALARTQIQLADVDVKEIRQSVHFIALELNQFLLMMFILVILNHWFVLLLVTLAPIFQFVFVLPVPEAHWGRFGFHVAAVDLIACIGMTILSFQDQRAKRAALEAEIKRLEQEM